MKQILFLSLTVFYISCARADLNVEMGFKLPNSTNLCVGVVDRIKGNRCREDEIVAYFNNESYVLNLDSGEGFKLIQDKKMAVKLSFDQSILTNAIAVDAIKDTGKSEIVNGNDAEIYTYTNSKGNYTLWIAKDLPNFETIKRDLVKRDRLRETTRVGLLYLSTLPGILLKCRADSVPTNALQFHVIISEESIDESIFDLPKDYHLYSTNAPVANTNQVISTTNEPAIK
jgi:Domain of unknown function (DUF4412)